MIQWKIKLFNGEERSFLMTVAILEHMIVITLLFSDNVIIDKPIRIRIEHLQVAKSAGKQVPLARENMYGKRAKTCNRLKVREKS